MASCNYWAIKQRLTVPFLVVHCLNVSLRRHDAYWKALMGQYLIIMIPVVSDSK